MAAFSPAELANIAKLNERDRTYNKDNGLAGTNTSMPASYQSNYNHSASAAENAAVNAAAQKSYSDWNSNNDWAASNSTNWNKMSTNQQAAWKQSGSNMAELNDANYLSKINTPGFVIGNGSMQGGYPGMPQTEKPATPGFQIGNGQMQGGYMPSAQQTQQTPPTAMSSQTMNPATGQAYTPQSGNANGQGAYPAFQGGSNKIPGQYSGVFAPDTPPAYTPPAPAVNTPPMPPAMDQAAIQKYAADQIAAKIAAATNSANTARTTAQGDAAQSTGVLDNQLAQAVARLKASQQQAQSGITTNKERADAITRDNRLLSDDSKQRNSNVFGGKYEYDTALIGREREISDRQGMEDYNSRIGSINQDAMNQQGAIEQDIGASKAGIQQGLTNLQNKITTDLQNLETSTGAERERLIREITADERQYAMALRGEDRADVMQNATLAQQKFQQEMDTFKTNYGIQKDTRDYAYQVGRDVKTDFNSDRAFNYGAGRDTKNDATNAANTAYQQGQDKIKNDRNTANDALVLRKQHIDEANYYSDKYGITVDPKDDFQLVLDQVAGKQTVAQQSAAQKAQEAQRSEAWKRVEQFGKVSSQADADLLGVPVGTESQKAKESALDVAYRNRTASNSEANTEIARANQTYNQSLQNAKLELDRQESGSKKDESISKLLTNSPLVQKKYNDDGDVIGVTVQESDKKALGDSIFTLGLDTAQNKKWFAYFGIDPSKLGN